jgi:transposase
VWAARGLVHAWDNSALSAIVGATSRASWRAHKKGHRYITIVVDHDSGRLVWAAPGRDRKTLNVFFTALGETRCAAITHVSADAAPWIADEFAAHCPDAVGCADAFHIVAWAGDALDQVRRDTWNAARKGGMSVHARDRACQILCVRGFPVTFQCDHLSRG